MIAKADPKHPIHPSSKPGPDGPGSLLAPGAAEVTADGVLHLAGSDLDWADLGATCRLSIDARVLVLAVRHGNQHAVCACKPRGLVNARNELRALGVALPGMGSGVSGIGSGKSAISNRRSAQRNHKSEILTAKVVRHTDGSSRWLAVQFQATQLTPRAKKSTSTTKAPRARRSHP